MKKIFAGALWEVVTDAWILYYVWHDARWPVAFVLTLLVVRCLFEDLTKQLLRLKAREHEAFLERLGRQGVESVRARR